MRYFWWVMLMAFASGCATTTQTVGGPGEVNHVVVVWLKEPGNESQLQKIDSASRGFVRTIPGLKRVEIGRPLPSTRPVVESGYDLLIIMRFESPAALAAYETHPEHLSAVRKTLQPLAARIRIYDAVETTPVTMPR